MIGLSIGLDREGQTAAAPTYDTDAAAYFAAMSSQMDSTRKGYFDAFVTGVKADGDWPKFDWMVCLAPHDIISGASQAGRLNLRNPAKSLIAVNSPVFSAIGATGDGATSYLHTNENPDAAGNVYSLNSAHVTTYCSAQNTGSGLKVHAGTMSGNLLRLTPSTSTSGVYSVNDNTAGALPQPSPASHLGHHIASRVAASGANCKCYYKGGTLIQPNTTASVGIPGFSTCIGRYASSYGNPTISFFTLGSGLDDAAAARFSARVLTLLTAIGAN